MGYNFANSKVKANASISSTGPTSVSLGLILGISIPIGVLLIVIIVVIMVLLRRRKFDNLYAAPYVPTYQENDKSYDQKRESSAKDIKQKEELFS